MAARWVQPLRLIPCRVLKPWGEEVWLNSPRPEGPAEIVGGSGGLAQALRRRPQLLGSSSATSARTCPSSPSSSARISRRRRISASGCWSGPRSSWAGYAASRNFWPVCAEACASPISVASRAFARVFGSWSADRSLAGMGRGSEAQMAEFVAALGDSPGCDARGLGPAHLRLRVRPTATVWPACSTWLICGAKPGTCS